MTIDGAAFIAGDWGSSAMRLYLCRSDDAGPTVISVARGAGVKETRDFERVFFDAARPWIDAHGSLPAVFSGMVGSTLGWRDTGYISCPVTIDQVAEALVCFRVNGIDVAIAPGLRCSNPFGLADVMRGEEAQVFGWLAAEPRCEDARHLLCLPGTHAKWALTRGDAIETFFTSMTGELHELLLRHSLLGRTLGRAVDAPLDLAAFDDGVARIIADPSLAIEHAIFAVRARVVTGDLDAAAAASFLSGLLIGAEVRDARAMLVERDLLVDPVVLIGAAPLVALYARAVTAAGGSSLSLTDESASVAGLARMLPRALVPA